MRILGSSQNSYVPAKADNVSDKDKFDKEQKSAANEKAAEQKQNTSIDAKDKYVPTAANYNAKSYGYSRPDLETINRLKSESERAYNNLRDLVKQLLERQGMSFQDLVAFDGEVIVDERARADAAAAIADGGPLSAEAVSDNIVEFAKAISGGDKNKLDTLRKAINQGFSEAERILGGQLPEISYKTRELIHQKLDAWANEE